MRMVVRVPVELPRRELDITGGIAIASLKAVHKLVGSVHVGSRHSAALVYPG